MLGFGTFGSIGVCLSKPSINCSPQVFFSLQYSCSYLINQPLGLFLYPIVDSRSSNVREEGHGLSIWVGHNICIWIHSLIDLEHQHKGFALLSISCEFEGWISFKSSICGWWSSGGTSSASTSTSASASWWRGGYSTTTTSSTSTRSDSGGSSSGC